MRSACSRLLASPRWPGWRVVIIYGLLSLWVPPEFAPYYDGAPRYHAALHRRIVAWREPSVMQYRWFVPMMAEGIHRVTGLSVHGSYVVLTVLTMWLLLVSFHLLLRRRFSTIACFAGVLVLCLAYNFASSWRYFHHYDILCMWCIVVAIEAVLRRSAWAYIGAMALLCLTKWSAAAVAVIFLAPAWFDRSINRSLRWRAIRGGAAAAALVLGSLHIPLIGIGRLFGSDGDPDYAHITHAQFVEMLLSPQAFALCLIYLLPGLISVVWGYRAMDRIWRRLLWYPLGIFICGMGAQVVIWETRTYFSAWIVFVPFMLAALFRESSDEARSLHSPDAGPTTDEAAAEGPELVEADNSDQDSLQ